MAMQRREFLKFSGATVAISVLPGLAAEDGEPLRIAALSDIHIYDWGSEKKGISPGEHGTLRSAFLYLRDRKIDAVTISGDLTGGKYEKSLAILGRLWREAFPDNKRPDGGHVEPIFVFGNHDGPVRCEEGLAAFKRECGLTWAPIYSVKVKGYAFICASWRCEKLLPAYIREHEAELGLRENRPFFCLMHPYPRHALWAQDLDFDSESGAAAECLKDYPNAVVLCGHVHRASADDRSIWQGDYTAIDCGTFGSCTDERGCENTRPHPKGKAFHMPLDDRFGKQGMILEGRPDRIEVERRDFTRSLEAAEPWVIPCGDRTVRPYDPDGCAKQTAVPQFADGAKLRTRTMNSALRNGQWAIFVALEFPTADATRGRAFDYEVRVVSEANGKVLLAKRYLSPDFHKPASCERNVQRFRLNAMDLPETGRYRLAVVPRNCFGGEGRPLLSGVFESKPGKSRARRAGGQWYI